MRWARPGTADSTSARPGPNSTDGQRSKTLRFAAPPGAAGQQENRRGSVHFGCPQWPQTGSLPCLPRNPPLSTAGLLPVFRGPGPGQPPLKPTASQPPQRRSPWRPPISLRREIPSPPIQGWNPSPARSPVPSRSPPRKRWMTSPGTNPSTTWFRSTSPRPWRRRRRRERSHQPQAIQKAGGRDLEPGRNRKQQGLPTQIAPTGRKENPSCDISR